MKRAAAQAHSGAYSPQAAESAVKGEKCLAGRARWRPASATTATRDLRGITETPTTALIPTLAAPIAPHLQWSPHAPHACTSFPHVCSSSPHACSSSPSWPHGRLQKV
ncbi:hypothetical protein FKM82_022825 [Ascaphus truei]